MIFQTKKTPLQALKTRCRKKLIIDMFSKGLVHGFGPKLAIFPSSFFQAIWARKMCFMIYQSEKNTFLCYKNKELKKRRRIAIFPKGFVHGFGPKIAIFQIFFFQAQQARKISFTIFQNEKLPFQAIKTRSTKSRKIDIFPKGLTHGFGTTMPFFFHLFFWQYRPGKYPLRYSRTKKRLSRL